MAIKTGLVYDDVYLAHRVPDDFPERPRRLQSVMARLKETALMERLLPIQPRRAEVQWLTAIHTPQYIRRVEAACAAGESQIDTPDMPISPRSYEAAVAAAGGVLAAIDAVVEAKVANAFCAVRPPGHHALADMAMGFCLFNNVAVGARYAQKKHGLERILIVDWDLHHGNGTQGAFYDDPGVLYFSTHCRPFYPGSGSAAERGTGKGDGFTVNVPLPPGTGDREFTKAFDENLVPAADRFRPDLVLVSAGFDAHGDDPLGGMKLTAACYGHLTDVVMDIVGRHCGGRLVSVLEGGYDLDALANCVEVHVRGLIG